ncbi:MAG: hypothetical protein QM765_05025 [Myxococcales bacterium]
MRNLLCACCAAVMALALTGCPEKIGGDTKDGNDVSDDASVLKKDAGGNTKTDSGTPFKDASTDPPDAACDPAANCLGRECGSRRVRRHLRHRRLCRRQAVQ